jgi:O-acetylhomoserine/O-acetylserine sulfhydrylase-like pyridoxal-dependent enzyme
MKLGSFLKSPNETKQYAIDYSKWLENGEILTSATFSASPSDMTIGSYVIDGTGAILSFYVSGGTDSGYYVVTVLATTSIGQIKEDTVHFNVRAAT